MITARLCNPNEQGPFPSFEHCVKHYVRVGDSDAVHLYVDLPEDSRVTIEFNGHEIFSEVLPAGPQPIPLSDLMSRAIHARQTARPIVRAFRHLAEPDFETSHPADREISVVIANPGRRGSVKATYIFRLLPPLRYDRAYSEHLRLAPDGCCDRGKRFCGSEDIVSAGVCWNCLHKLAAGATQCTECGADQSDDEF